MLIYIELSKWSKFRGKKSQDFLLFICDRSVFLSERSEKFPICLTSIFGRRLVRWQTAPGKFFLWASREFSLEHPTQDGSRDGSGERRIRWTMLFSRNPLESYDFICEDSGKNYGFWESGSILDEGFLLILVKLEQLWPCYSVRNYLTILFWLKTK